MDIDRGKLIQFMMDYFDDEEIVMLCLVEFREVHSNFASGMGKQRKVLDVVAWCDRHGETDKLLAALQREREPLFREWFGEQSTARPPRSQRPRRSITRNPRQIFLSHAHEDAAFAQRLAADLEAAGWVVWIAPDSIRPGEPWAAAINRGLEESAFFVLVLTPHAVASKWVTHETFAAIEMERDGDVQLIPLQVEPCQLPVLWRSYQHIPFRTGYDDGLNRLLQELEGRRTTSEDVVLSMPKDGQGASEDAPLRTVKVAANTRVHPITGKVMVRIPAGEFLYGDKKQTVRLPEYWIDKTSVTNADYARFVVATQQKPPSHWKDNMPPQEVADHPVVNVSWDDAVAYAKWAGCRLPTEQEWEKAARGTDGRTYPWGNKWRENHCNTEESGIESTTAVGQFSPQGDSPYGCVDMSGNVWEWTSTEESRDRVVRSCSWLYNRSSARVFLRFIFKPYGSCHANGFRVVVPVLSGS